MGNALPDQEIGQGAVLRIGPGVVALQPLGLDPVGAKEGDRPLHEADHRRAPLVAMQLGVGEAGVVVDNRVSELVSHPFAHLRTAAGAVAGHRVAGTGEASKALGVRLQQVARAGPLETAHRLLRGGRPAREAAPEKAAGDSRVGDAELGGDQPRPPAGAPALFADAVVDLLARSGTAAGAVLRSGPAGRRGCGARPRLPACRQRVTQVWAVDLDTFEAAAAASNVRCSSSTSATRRRLPFGVSGALRCCIRASLRS
jgi:hypothetical protein